MQVNPHYCYEHHRYHAKHNYLALGRRASSDRDTPAIDGIDLPDLGMIGYVMLGLGVFFLICGVWAYAVRRRARRGERKARAMRGLEEAEEMYVDGEECEVMEV